MTHDPRPRAGLDSDLIRLSRGRLVVDPVYNIWDTPFSFQPEDVEGIR
jgi:hypothetical protein